MDSKDYNICQKEMLKSPKGTPVWARLAEMLGYSTKESLRKQFNREKNRRGDLYEPSREYMEPVVGVIDLETLYMELAGWNLYQDRFATNAILRESCLLSWAAMYVKTGKIVSDILTPEESVSRDSFRVAASARDFIHSCNILIGHNIKQFDDKVFNTEFLLHELKPVDHKQIDTLEIMRTEFKLPSNKLGYVNKRLGIKQKMENEGLPLWIACSSGDSDALSRMMEYNIGDVVATEELYWKIRPFAGASVPTFQPYSESTERTCDCGCSEFVHDGYFYTNSGKYNRMACSNCGSLFRDKKNLLPKNKRDNILISI